MEKFFDEMCRRVKEWNGDFVKIDNQGFHKCFKDMVAIGESSKNVQNASYSQKDIIILYYYSIFSDHGGYVYILRLTTRSQKRHICCFHV